MGNTISRLLNSYETGALTRRELIQGLTMVAVATTPAAGFQRDGLDLNKLHHVQINASDVRRSANFYKNVLGLSLMRVGPASDPDCCPDESAFLGLGGNDDPGNLVLAIRRKTPVGQVDHIGFSVNDFDRDATTRTLTERGATPKQEPTTGYYVEDPDGIKVQLL